MPSIYLRRSPSLPPAPALAVGAAAPRAEALDVSQGRSLVAFLRHVGCPFSEQVVKRLREWAERNRDVSVHLVSHGDEAVTQQWLSLIGGVGRMHWVPDRDRALYAQWGLGDAPLWHFAGPRSLWGVVCLWPQGIRNRIATGTRWQRAGMFMVRDGVVVWHHVPESAQEFSLPPT